MLAAGVVDDHAGGEHDSTFLGGALFVHPWRGLFLMAGLGGEREHGHDALAVRFGLGYQLHLTDHLSVGPSAYLDVVEGHAKGVVGLSLGVGFGR